MGTVGSAICAIICLMGASVVFGVGVILTIEHGLPDAKEAALGLLLLATLITPAVLAFMGV